MAQCHIYRKYFATGGIQTCDPCELRSQALTNVKLLKIQTHTPKKYMYCNYPKIWLIKSFHRVMHPKDAEGMANSVDP